MMNDERKNKRKQRALLISPLLLSFIIHRSVFIVPKGGSEWRRERKFS